MFLRKVFHFKLWGLLLFFPTILLSQSFSDHLVINEVFLDTTNQEISWIEIFNPTSKNITLQVLFASSIRTPNLLPLEVKRKGGINITAGEYIIICWNKEKFQSNWNVPLQTQLIDNLRFLKTGGALRILGVDENSNRAQDDLLYGTPTDAIKSESISPLGFSRNGYSFSRIPNGFDTNNCTNDFTITTPTPSKENIK